MDVRRELESRRAPVDLDPDEFRRLGHETVDAIADFLHTLRERPVTPGESGTPSVANPDPPAASSAST